MVKLFKVKRTIMLINRFYQSTVGIQVEIKIQHRNQASQSILMQNTYQMAMKYIKKQRVEKHINLQIKREMRYFIVSSQFKNMINWI